MCSEIAQARPKPVEAISVVSSGQRLPRTIVSRSTSAELVDDDERVLRGRLRTVELSFTGRERGIRDGIP